jgi:acyl-CoA dehydrogenase
VYSFEPNDEQKMLIDVCRRFAENDLRLAAHDADEGDDFKPALIEKGWELGVLQASVPETYGGFGDRSVVTSVLALEELAWGDLAGSMAVLAPGSIRSSYFVMWIGRPEKLSICRELSKLNGRLIHPP